MAMLALGVTNAWADVITLTTNSTTVGKGTPVEGKFDYKLTFTSTTDAGDAYVQNAKNSSIFNTVAIPGTITSIKLTDCATTSTKTDGSFKVYGGTSSGNGCTNEMANITGLSSTETDKTIDFSGNYAYFKIVVGSARVLKISSIVITYTPSGSETPDPTPSKLSTPANLKEASIAETSATLSWDAVANASNYSVTINGNTETVTTNSYSATGLTAGTEYTWSVVAKGDGTNYTDSEAAQHTFTTKTASTPEEPENPEQPEVITCAQAVEICETTGETSTTETYTIHGYVTSIITAYSSTHGNISFWMADTKDGGEVLQCFRVKPVKDGEENVKVGDKVEVIGTLVNYYGNTPEVNAGGTYTILEVGEEVVEDGYVFANDANNPGNAGDWFTGTIDSYTTWTATKGGSNNPKYYDTGTGLRVYNGGTFSITSTKLIETVTLTFAGTSYTFSTDNTKNPQTVTVNANSYEWSVGRTCRLQKIEIVYGSSDVVIVKTLQSIALSGMTTTYETGDVFNFNGTCTATYAVTKDDVAQEDEQKVVTPTSVSEPDMSTTGEKEVTVTYTEEDVTVIATYIITVNLAEGDKLVLETTGVEGTSYADWSNVQGASGAVYAGNSAGGNNSIQLRKSAEDKPAAGIITTTSGGLIRKVKVGWNINTADGRTLNVYGKNSAYTAVSELYDNATAGELLGTIVEGTSTELVINGDFEYVGLVSAGSALYLDKVVFVWEENEDPDGPATALDNIAIEGKAVKAIVNGQLVIVKDGVKFNAQGQVIK